MLTAKQYHIRVKPIGEAIVEHDQVVKLIGTFRIFLPMQEMVS